MRNCSGEDEWIPALQKQRQESYSLCGNDVEALFPSLDDLGSARIARQAVLLSDMVVDNVDYTRALRYLHIVGGKDYMAQIGLGRIMPKWAGKRSDLVSVGGDLSKSDGGWYDTRREISEYEKKIIISRVVEIAVLVSMGTHVYSFGNKLYLQASGGPIGMRATASLANVVMKQWDCALDELLRNEGLVLDLLVRYVDDIRIALASLNEGWRWHNNSFCFRWEWRDEDLCSDVTDQQRTLRELTKAMNSMVGFLKFTG